MSRRNTRNSLDSAFVPSSSASASSPATNATQPSAAEPAELSPEFIQMVARAVKAAMTAEHGGPARGGMLQGDSVPGIQHATSSSSVTSVGGFLGVPASHINGPPATLVSIAAGQASIQGQQGRSPLVVPTFVNAFNPLPSASLGSIASSINLTSTSNSVFSVPNIPGLPALLPSVNQPFDVGPGFSPIPAKVVNQIVAGKFVDQHYADRFAATVPLRIKRT